MWPINLLFVFLNGYFMFESEEYSPMWWLNLLAVAINFSAVVNALG
jgi:hypothetical protein